MESKKCEHGGCKLPKNNNRYLWQLAYIFLGLIILFFRMENFTFFQIFLFSFPILVDVSYDGIDTKLLRFVRDAFFILNLATIVVCFLGIVGIFVDSGDSFTISLEVLSSNVFAIHKRIFAIAISLNLLIPLIYYGTSPCQKNEETLSILNKKHRKEEPV